MEESKPTEKLIGDDEIVGKPLVDTENYDAVLSSGNASTENGPLKTDIPMTNKISVGLENFITETEIDKAEIATTMRETNEPKSADNDTVMKYEDLDQLGYAKGFDKTCKEGLNSTAIGAEPIENLSESVEYLLDDIDNFIANTNANLAEIVKRKSDSRKTIVSVMQTLRNKITEKEKVLTNQNDLEFLRCEDKLQVRLKTASNLKQRIEAFAVNSDNDELNGASYSEGLEQHFAELESRFSNIQNDMICPELKVLNDDISMLDGLLFAKFENQSSFSNVQDTPSTLKQSHAETCTGINEKGQLYCRAPADVLDPLLSSMIWVNGIIAVTDRSNKNVKFFKDNGLFLHEVIFRPDEPYGICHMSTEYGSEEVYAITLPMKRKIYVINLTSDGARKPYVRYDVVTPVGYSGITCNEKNLIVTAVGTNFPRIDILDFGGLAQMSFAVDADNRPLFGFPRFVAADGIMNIVSDWRQNKIVFIRKDGTIFGKYNGTADHPLENPYGVAVNGNGYIFVMDGKSGAIHVVDRSYELVQLIEDTMRLDRPTLIAHDAKSESLAISHDKGNILFIPAPNAFSKS